MAYLFEPHCHTGEFGWCARVPAAELVADYEAAGYDGVIITNHYFDRGFAEMHGSSWPGLVDIYLAGYDAACRAVSRPDFQVLLGLELRFHDHMNDFLVYGVDRDFLIEYPELYRMTVSSFRPFADRHGLCFIQAHPYREGNEPVPTRYLHGLEVYNGNPRHDNGNEHAAASARRHGLLEVASSDYHRREDLGYGGIYFSERPGSSRGLGRQMLDGLISGLYIADRDERERLAAIA